MSFKENVDLYVDQSAKNLNFRKDLLEHIKSTHSLIKVNVGVELDKTIHGDHSHWGVTQNIFYPVKVE